MSAPYARKDADWTELDALIDAELDVVLSRHARPAAVGSVPVGSVPVDLATEEMLFLAQACEFLGRHADPSRLIAELAEKFADFVA